MAKHKKYKKGGQIGGGIGTAVGAGIGTIIAPGIGTSVGATAGGGLGRAIGTAVSNRPQQQVNTPSLSKTNQMRNQWKFEEGGQVNPAQSQAINIESGELEVDPATGEVIRDFKDKPPHPEQGMHPDGNIKAEQGNIIIPDKFREAYLEADSSERKQIINKVVADQQQRESQQLPEEQPQESVQQPMGQRAPQQMSPQQMSPMMKKGGKVKYQEGGEIWDLEETRQTGPMSRSTDWNLEGVRRRGGRNVPAARGLRQDSQGFNPEEVPPAEEGVDYGGIARHVGRAVPAAINLYRGIQGTDVPDVPEVSRAPLEAMPTETPTRQVTEESRRQMRASHRRAQDHTDPLMRQIGHQIADRAHRRQTEEISERATRQDQQLASQKASMQAQLDSQERQLAMQGQDRELRAEGMRQEHINQAAAEVANIVSQIEADEMMEDHHTMELARIIGTSPPEVAEKLYSLLSPSQQRQVNQQIQQ